MSSTSKVTAEGRLYYARAKERELAGDMAAAITLYRKAERAGHPLVDIDDEEDGCNDDGDASKEKSSSKEEDRVMMIGIGGCTRSGKSTLAAALAAWWTEYLQGHQRGVREEEGEEDIILNRAKTFYQEWHNNYNTKCEEGENAGEEEKTIAKVMVVTGDKYWKDVIPWSDDAGESNWERVEAVDFRSMNIAIDHARSALLQQFEQADEEEVGLRAVLIVDSFLALAHTETSQRFEAGMLLTLSKSVCRQRRVADDGEVGNQRTEEEKKRRQERMEKYFESCIWPSFCEYSSPEILQPWLSERKVEEGGEDRQHKHGDENELKKLFVLDGEDSPEANFIAAVSFLLPRLKMAKYKRYNNGSKGNSPMFTTAAYAKDKLVTHWNNIRE
ncbi:ribosylnicotinamide kinase [Balamuthia mandrillaris]